MINWVYVYLFFIIILSSLFWEALARKAIRILYVNLVFIWKKYEIVIHKFLNLEKGQYKKTSLVASY